MIDWTAYVCCMFVMTIYYTYRCRPTEGIIPYVKKKGNLDFVLNVLGIFALMTIWPVWLVRDAMINGGK